MAPMGGQSAGSQLSGLQDGSIVPSQPSSSSIRAVRPATVSGAVRVRRASSPVHRSRQLIPVDPLAIIRCHHGLGRAGRHSQILPPDGEGELLRLAASPASAAGGEGEGHHQYANQQGSPHRSDLQIQDPDRTWASRVSGSRSTRSPGVIPYSPGFRRSGPRPPRGDIRRPGPPAPAPTPVPAGRG